MWALKIPGCLFKFTQQSDIDTALWQHNLDICQSVYHIERRESSGGETPLFCLQPQCEIASGYQTLLSPDIVKGFLPFASLSSLGLRDEKKKCCVCVCRETGRDIGMQTDKKRAEKLHTIQSHTLTNIHPRNPPPKKRFIVTLLMLLYLLLCVCMYVWPWICSLESKSIPHTWAVFEVTPSFIHALFPAWWIIWVQQYHNRQ